MTKDTYVADYDEAVTQHYRKVAEADGLSSTSTMADNITRATETKAIISYVRAALARRKSSGEMEPAVVMDVGCGNGYTLEVLSKEFPECQFVGVEKSDELRELAVSRFVDSDTVSVFGGDLRDPDFSQGKIADILVCQRVLINLLDPSDQKQGYRNVIGTVKKGGSMLFIECFTSSLNNLNVAREEFDLEPIPPAHHNLYLEDDFFQEEGVTVHGLDEFGFSLPENFLSTHFYVTRVLHPVITNNAPFKRNSEFVNFFSAALVPCAGDYAPLKLTVLEKS